MDAERRRREFGKWLKQQLVERGWGYAEFGRRCGDVSRQTVQSWANAERMPDPPSCYRIAEALGIDPDEVLSLAGHRPMTDSETSLYQENRQLRETVRLLTNVEHLREERDFNERLIQVRGLIAADAIRYTDDTGMEPLPVTQSRLKGARSPFGLLVTGDCMRAIGIFAGDVIIVDKDPDRRPNHGELVVVRLGTESTFKRWWVVSDNEVELRDGDGNAVMTLHPLMDEFEIEGFYVTYEPLAER